MRGDRLKELRKAKKLSQDKLGEIAGVSRVQINRYENGKAVPDFSTIIKIADALHASIDYLVGRTDVNWIQPISEVPLSAQAPSLSTVPTFTPELQTSTPACTDFQSRIPAARTGAPSLLQNEKEQPEPSQTAPADPSAAPAPFSADQLAFLDNRLDQHGQLLDQRLDQFKYDLLEAIREDISSLSEKKHG